MSDPDHSADPATLHVRSAGPVSGSLRAPGDKSISHRAAILAAIAEGATSIRGYLPARDTLATLDAMRALGVRIDGPAAGGVTVHGVGRAGLRAPSGDVDLGNSGTGMRLLSGLLAGQSFRSRLIGDASLSRRPMDRIIEPLSAMGADIDAAAGQRPPLTITGRSPLSAIDYTSPVASAQVKSCVLLAGLYADGETTVTEPLATRDHTERMLSAFGQPCRRSGRSASVTGGGELHGTDIEVPADISAAAFWVVAATIVSGSELVLEHVGINPLRAGALSVLRRMGADIALRDERTIGGEPVADLVVRAAPLTGTDIGPEEVPAAVDELPVLFVAAAAAQGTTRVRGAAELRVKESDRLSVMAEALQRLGVTVHEREDGLDIIGGAIGGGRVAAAGDHRCAMALAVAGMAADNMVTIDDCANIATSYPGFTGHARALGLDVVGESDS